MPSPPALTCMYSPARLVHSHPLNYLTTMWIHYTAKFKLRFQMDECWITGTTAEQQMLELQELLVGFSWSFWIFSLLSGLSCFIFHFNYLSFPHFHLSLKFHLQFYSQILILIFFLSPPSTPLLCSIHHHLAPPTLAEWAHKLPSHFTHLMLLVMPQCCSLCPPPWLSKSCHKHTVCFQTL